VLVNISRPSNSAGIVVKIALRYLRFILFSFLSLYVVLIGFPAAFYGRCLYVPILQEGGEENIA
jgi:hypothetical protein